MTNTLKPETCAMSKVKPRPYSEWHEGIGDVLWWKFQIDEPPYCGTPNDAGFEVAIEITTHTLSGDPETTVIRRHVGGWPGYHTHWTPLQIPDEPQE